MGCTAVFALMMEAARTSETSVDIQLRTRQYIPEDSDIQKYNGQINVLTYQVLDEIGARLEHFLRKYLEQLELKVQVSRATAWKLAKILHRQPHKESPSD
jgi:ABC-type Zn2+ transport system substrate-binding protein/surface adhesin